MAIIIGLCSEIGNNLESHSSEEWTTQLGEVTAYERMSHKMCNKGQKIHAYVGQIHFNCT